MQVDVLDAMPASVVSRAAAGDRLAFGEIVVRFHDDLARVGFAVSGDIEIGRDAAQAAWETAWRKLPSLRDTTKLRSWLLVIAANEARRLARRRRLRTILELRSIPSAGERDLDGTAIGLDLREALARLKARDRQLLALRYSIGMTSEEIGEVMSLSPSGVRTQIARLLARLRKELSDA